MIYLSGKLKREHIGSRPDIGVIVSFRRENPKSVSGHQLKLFAKTKFGVDNNCFNDPNIDVQKYLEWLNIFQPYAPNCLFANAPDVVGNARETWLRSESVLPRIREAGLPAGFVAQDGIESYPIRWGAFDVLFLGGSTDWKLSEEAFQVAREAKEHGLWVHMGRVNSRRRLRIAVMALCDSADGTHFVFRPDHYTARMGDWLDEIKSQPFLDYEGAYMKTTHRLQVKAVCPVNGKPDVYDCRIVTSRVIPVEDILALVESVKNEKVFQETLCERLAGELACEVTLAGTHSGVATEVTCGSVGPLDQHQPNCKFVNLFEGRETVCSLMN